MDEHLLHGIWAKLDRADESLDTLEREWKAGEDIKAVRVRFEYDPQTEWHTAEIIGVHAEPRLSVLAGESLYQARSALEHVVRVLVKLNHKKPGRHNTFPVWDSGTKDKFLRTTRRPPTAKRAAGMLYGTSLRATAFIEALQPYNARHPNLPHHSFLHRLNVMAQEDRHMTLHQSFVWTDPASIRPLFTARPGSAITHFRRLYRPWQSLVEGTKIARLRIEPINSQAQVNVQDDLAIDIAFGDRREVTALQALRDINSNVRQTIGFMQGFL